MRKRLLNQFVSPKRRMVSDIIVSLVSTLLMRARSSSPRLVSVACVRRPAAASAVSGGPITASSVVSDIVADMMAYVKRECLINESSE